MKEQWEDQRDEKNNGRSKRTNTSVKIFVTIVVFVNCKSLY